MKTIGSEQIVHGADGETYIVRGIEDGYAVLHCHLEQVAQFKRKWEATRAIEAGNL